METRGVGWSGEEMGWSMHTWSRALEERYHIIVSMDFVDRDH